jgi:hypothetical protein
MSLSFSRLIPKFRIKCYFFLITNFDQFGINVKDTSSMRQDAPKDLSVDLVLS